MLKLLRLISERRLHGILCPVKFTEHRVKVEIDDILIHPLAETVETPLQLCPLALRQLRGEAIPHRRLLRMAGDAVNLLGEVSGNHEIRRIITAPHTALRLRHAHRDKVGIRKLHRIGRIVKIFFAASYAVIQIDHRNTPAVLCRTDRRRRCPAL